MQLTNLRPTFSPRKSKRIGRGGKRGTTSGRGTKGQKSRAGARIRPAERDIIKRLPKLRGFQFHTGRGKSVPVPVGAVNAAFQHGETVSPKALYDRGVIGRAASGMRAVKLLGEGEVTKKLLVENCKVSVSAKAKIEKAGGAVK